MWTVIKFDKKKYYLLLRELKDKLGGDCVIYRPKILIQKYKKNKLIDKEVDFLELETFYFTSIYILQYLQCLFTINDNVLCFKKNTKPPKKLT